MPIQRVEIKTVHHKWYETMYPYYKFACIPMIKMNQFVNSLK